MIRPSRTASRSGTSSRGCAVESAISRPGGGGRSMRRSCARSTSRGDLSRLAHHAEEAEEDGCRARVRHRGGRRGRGSELAPRGSRRSTRARSGIADGLGTAERASLLDRYAEEALLTGQYESSVIGTAGSARALPTARRPLRVGETLSRLTNAYTRLGRNRKPRTRAVRRSRCSSRFRPGRELGVGVRRPGVRADAQPRQRRGRGLGGEGSRGGRRRSATGRWRPTG